MVNVQKQQQQQQRQLHVLDLHSTAHQHECSYSNLENHPLQFHCLLPLFQGMPIVVDADDAPAIPYSAAAGGGDAVNLGIARAKGESKEEKKARKEAVKLQV